MKVQSRTQFLLFSAVLSGFLLVSTHFSGIGGCGGSSSSSGGLSLEASVSTPSSAGLSLPTLAIGKNGIAVTPKHVEETATEGVECHAEDLAGTKIGESCTTAADGTCEITGLTSAQLAAGVVVVSTDSDGVEMHSYVEPDTADITAAESSGEALPAPVNTETDLAYAVILTSCSDDLDGCSATVDPKCIGEAIPTVVGDEDPSAEDTGGYFEALFAAHAEAIAAGAALVAPPAELMRDALGGAPTALVDVVGSTVSDVPVSDAVTNSLTGATALIEAYCTIDSSTGEAHWDGVKADATGAGEEFNAAAVAGIFKRFTPTEVGEYGAAAFRGYAAALPTIAGGFAMFGSHDEARQTAVQYFRQGAFADSSKAGAAFGFMFAAFPPPPTAGDWQNVSFTGFDPQVGALAAHNGFLEYASGTSTFADASSIYAGFRDVLGDPTHRQAFAMGGSSAFGSYVAAFTANSSGFDPTAFKGGIKAPPGGSCDSNDDCLPCDACTNNVCTSLSTTMGSSCDKGNACDGITTCVGAAVAGFGGRCMCSAGVPMGAFVHVAGGTGPQEFGVAGGYTAPTAGGTGTACGTGLPACNSGLECTAGDHGMCVGGDFKSGPYSPCGSNADCFSNSCVGGLCAFGGTFTAGTNAIGQPCAGPADCSSFFCSAGVCAAPSGDFAGATTGAGLKAAGESCTSGSECASFFCQFSSGSTGVCAAPTGGGGSPTSLPAGSPCFGNAECQSANCNMATHMCM